MIRIYFDQLEQLKAQEMDRLQELNGAGVGFLDDDDDDVEWIMMITLRVKA